MDNANSTTVSTPLRLNAKDLSGKVFGRLTAVTRVASKRQPTQYICQCSCGNAITVRGSALPSGNTTSCGCLQKERVREVHTKHGMTGVPEYEVWKSMWARCTNPKDKRYHLYKDRTPPESWKDFSVFYEAVGSRPSVDHSLDRIDNSQPYGPDNCQWTTSDVQQNNTSANVWLEHNGERRTVSQWAHLVGLNPGTLHGRLRRGWSVEKALSTVPQLP
jgi:hypothetical protein